MLIRLSKILLVACIGLYFAVIVLNNVADYDTNFGWVEHVLKMDSIFSGNKNTHRAINSPTLHHLTYCAIIAFETLITALVMTGTFRLFKARKSATGFQSQKGLAVLGLTLIFVLMVFGFMTVGGEWFFMWQSQTWGSGLHAALRMVTVSGIALIVLLQQEAE